VCRGRRGGTHSARLEAAKERAHGGSSERSSDRRAGQWRACEVVVVVVQAAQGIGVRRGLMPLYDRSRMQNAGVWYDVKAQKGQHGEDTAQQQERQ
jgi:hypothetical protein